MIGTVLKTHQAGEGYGYGHEAWWLVDGVKVMCVRRCRSRYRIQGLDGRNEHFTAGVLRTISYDKYFFL
jgi:hypothetical protein